jgi:hypothetical protein
LPGKRLARLKQTRWGAWLSSWSWKRSAQLVLLRIGYYAILIVYAAAALQICGIYLSHIVVLSTIPLVPVANALPSAAGLGTREVALQKLLEPWLASEHDRAILLAMSLVWSTSMLLGRVVIGLAILWFFPLPELGLEEEQEPGEEPAGKILREG